MGGIIQALIFILSLGLSMSAPANTLYFVKFSNPGCSALPWIHPPNRSLKKTEGQFIKFGMTIPNRTVNRRYSSSFTIEPAKADSLIGKGKMVVTTKTKREVRITLERQIEFVFPEGIKGLKAAYDKRLPPGKYLAEVSSKHGNRMLISQSHIFSVK